MIKEIFFDIPLEEGNALEQAAVENGIPIENKGTTEKGLLRYELVMKSMWEAIIYGHDLGNLNIPVNPGSGQPAPKTNLKKMWNRYQQLIKLLVLLLFPVFVSGQWKLTKNKAVTGGLVLVGGAAKGFNETLMFHYKSFERAFPDANRQWFDPRISWKNKYKDRDRTKGAAFPLSTTVLVGFTDQYHLNNLIHHTAIASALVIKIGEKQKFKYYLIDFLYYTLCYQLGFSTTYYTFKL